MPKYRKKPVEAVEWKGSAESFEEIKKMGFPWEPGDIGTETFYITALTGKVLVSKGDWVVKEASGEVYPVNPDVFKKYYDVETRQPYDRPVGGPVPQMGS